jgi:predicted ester cyclase
LLDPRYVDHDAGPGVPPGIEGIRGIITTFRTAFPDLAFEIHDQIQEGDRLATRYTFHGTHQGPLWAIPATGRRVSMKGISIYRVSGSRLAEAWVQYDSLGLMQQLGMAPEPA